MKINVKKRNLVIGLSVFLVVFGLTLSHYRNEVLTAAYPYASRSMKRYILRKLVNSNKDTRINVIRILDWETRHISALPVFEYDKAITNLDTYYFGDIVDRILKAKPRYFTSQAAISFFLSQIDVFKKLNKILLSIVVVGLSNNDEYYSSGYQRCICEIFINKFNRRSQLVVGEKVKLRSLDIPDFSDQTDHVQLRKLLLVEYELSTQRKFSPRLLEYCTTKDRKVRKGFTEFAIALLSEQEMIINGEFLGNQSDFFVDPSNMPMTDVTFLKHVAYDRWLSETDQLSFIKTVIDNIEASGDFTHDNLHREFYLNTLFKAFGYIVIEETADHYDRISTEAIDYLTDRIDVPTDRKATEKALKPEYRAQFSRYCESIDKLAKIFNAK